LVEPSRPRRLGFERLEDRRLLAHLVQFAPNLPPEAILAEVQVAYRRANDDVWTSLQELDWSLVGSSPSAGIEVRFDAGLLGQKYDLRLTATDTLGNVATDDASVYYSHLDFTGWAGDVITLDLSQQGAHSGFDSHSVTLVSGGSTLLTDLDDVAFADSGRLDVAPDATFLATIAGQFVLQDEAFTFEVAVRPGFSVRGTDRVQLESTELNRYRLQ
jgi:hypothetical protein